MQQSDFQQFSTQLETSQTNASQTNIAIIYEQIKNFINQPMFEDTNIGPITEEQFSQILTFYLNNCHNDNCLNSFYSGLNILQKQILDQINNLYKNFKKSKEELIKFCIRTAFRYLTNNLMNESKIKLQKLAQKKLFQKYFENTKFVMPYKKKQTSFKSMNTKFLKVLFQSQNFIMDFQQFLNNFQTFVNQTNQRKINILIDSISFPIYIPILKPTKRLPWTKYALEQALQVGYELLEYTKPQQLKSDQNSTLQI